MAHEIMQVVKPFDLVTATIRGENCTSVSLVVPLVLGLNNVHITPMHGTFSQEDGGCAVFKDTDS
jgi:hypothetical protein